MLFSTPWYDYPRLIGSNLNRKVPFSFSWSLHGFQGLATEGVRILCQYLTQSSLQLAANNGEVNITCSKNCMTAHACRAQVFITIVDVIGADCSAGHHDASQCARLSQARVAKHCLQKSCQKIMLKLSFLRSYCGCKDLKAVRPYGFFRLGTIAQETWPGIT